MKNFKKIFSLFLIWLLLVSPAFGAGLTPDILNENFDTSANWTDSDVLSGDSYVSNGWLYLTTVAAASTTVARREATYLPALPGKYTYEIKVKTGAYLGTVANNDIFVVFLDTTTIRFSFFLASNGLFISYGIGQYTEVGTDIVTPGETNVWRFQIDKSTEASAVVEVFKDGVSQGSGIDCSFELAGTYQHLVLQRAFTTANQDTRIDYIRIATGLGAINDTSNPIVNIF
jgi:hypothetical protein